MSASSEFGRGSTFSFYVPYSPCSSYSEEQRQQNARSNLRSDSLIRSHSNGDITRLNGCKVLVVDDNAPLRKVLTRQLTRIGCTCVEAENGQQAVLTFETNSDFDIVVLDLIMPVMDG